MRRLLALALTAGAALLAGCGGGDAPDAEAPAPRADAPGGAAAPKPTSAPRATPTPAPTVSERAEQALARGRIGVVDADRQALVRPKSLRVNKEQTLSAVDWTGWGSDQATGRGTVRTLECDPSCAQGSADESDAELVLSAPRVCGSRRYYAEGVLTYQDTDPDRRRKAAVYLLTPC